jgi:transcriptional regulator with XRE-family HTH domain
MADHANQRAPRGVPLPYLRAYRARALLGQQDLARAIGLSKSAISNFECGDNASFRAIRLIASALGVAPQVLVDVAPDTGKEK